MKLDAEVARVAKEMDQMHGWDLPVVRFVEKQDGDTPLGGEMRLTWEPPTGDEQLH